MACHYAEPGHTPLVIGALYVRWLRWMSAPYRYRLRSVNEATGMATIVSCTGERRLVRTSELTRWHLLSAAQAIGLDGPPDNRHGL